jgi:hypothetical protein
MASAIHARYADDVCGTQDRDVCLGPGGHGAAPRFGSSTVLEPYSRLPRAARKVFSC